ncbi:phage tail protein, partial [Clostridium beijerinckii]|uniref:phage tail protein n=1 Tax=Clostridium beijerinckii TaxID=1520 RepID=UPI00098BFD2E
PTTVIQTTSDSVTNTKRIDENEIAYISGNDATEISLPITAGTAYDKTSLEVYAKGRKVDATAYTLDDANKKLKLNANACDAGASLEVKYKEVKTNANTETVTVEALSSIKNGVVLSNNADKIVSVAKADASSVTLYNLDGDKTTIIISDTSVKVGDAITVQYESYTYARHDVRATAATSLQVVALKNTAATGSEPVLYIDNAKVLDPSAYSFDAATNTIKIIKENFKMNQTISVSYFVQTTASVNSSIKIQSIFGGEIYNEGIVEVKDLINSDGSVMGKKVIITKPESKQTLSEAPQVYTSIDYPTFGLLAEAITANNNIYEAYTEDENELTANLVASSSYLSNGEDGTDLTADELFEALSGKRDGNGFILAQGAYQILENYQVDQIVPVGVYADDKLSDKNANFAYELALYCAISSYRNKTTIGAIPMKPIKDTTLANIQKYAKYLATYDNTYYMLDEAGSPIKDSEGNKFDLGKYISVVAGPKVLFNHSVNALREGNAAVMYMAYT